MNKLTRWIDFTNEKVCLKINQIYLQKIDSGYSTNIVLNPLFYPYYILRLFLVGLNVLRFNKQLYLPYSWALDKKQQLPLSSSKTVEILFTLLGLRFFSKPNQDPYYYNKQVNKIELSFEEHTTPTVSIIVHSANERTTLEACLKSVFLNTHKTDNFEVIVVDNSNNAEILKSVKDSAGVTYIKDETLSKNLSSCKKAITIAKGKYICLLNAKAIVLPSWLESLIETIQDDPEVGCVGSKILSQYGLIKQAGGVVDQSGNYSNYGSYQHVRAFNCDYKRPVDFCDTVILLSKSDLNEVNGFDSNIESPTYQVIDLCFSIRHQLGKTVIYQPSSTILIISGNNRRNAFKKLRENDSAFLSKWKSILGNQYQFLNIEAAATRFLPQKTISVIDSYLPFFDKESGSNRLFQLLKIFKKLGYHVKFIPHDGKYVAPYYRILTSKLGIPVAYNFSGKKQFKSSISALVKTSEILWISRPNLNLKYQYLVQRFAKIKWIYDTVDLHYVRFLRQAAKENKPRLIKKAAKFKKLELALASAANATIAITDVEKDMLLNENIKNVFVIPNVHSPKTFEQSKIFTERKGIVFIGGYGHPPNVDAAIWLIKEIMPLVIEKLGDIPIYLLGAHPTPAISELASKNVFVPGYLHDVDPYFLNSRIFVAPLRYGAGMKGKIGQSLEFGLPIVSTTIGVEGMNLIHNQNVLIADNTESFANQIIRLYQDQQIWEEIRNQSLKAIYEYTPEMIGEKLQSLFEKIQQTS
ncbi:glycosyltransferase [Pedobacter frigiditerrae]|uniref:glycosyltransferase n=1 Tax=Pedobacter frigiditerrae TaxID=2530452 RepID=UPI00293114FD|nr:glycosyltransferase [Pedobacter frigiditerrae]